jgi:predicted RNase H-like HicB family nuclease/uncharacterized damage-inducible protein DinB
MNHFDLYLESGPRRRKTMVHVLDLLGCIAQGPTTEEALEGTPEAIRVYLRFLQRQGEAVDPEAPFTITVTEHVMAGSWLGNGDPTPGFAPDFDPFSVEDLTIYLRRLTWLQDSLLGLVRELPREQLEADPPGGGRPIARIIEHVAESLGTYLRYIVGKVDGLSEALRVVQEDPTAMTRLWEICNARLEMMSEEERTQPVPHGQVTWTARRGLRRMLEHTWEHRLEIDRRIADCGLRIVDSVPFGYRGLKEE